MTDRWSSLKRRKGHALWDRARALARQGKTDQEIAAKLEIPLLNVQAMTHEIRAKEQKQ